MEIVRFATDSFFPKKGNIVEQIELFNRTTCWNIYHHEALQKPILAICWVHYLVNGNPLNKMPKEQKRKGMNFFNKYKYYIRE